MSQQILNRNRERRKKKNLREIQRQWLDNILHFRVRFYSTNFRETAPAHGHSQSKVDDCDRLVLSEPNPLCEGIPSVSQRQEICLLQPAVTSDTHIMPSLASSNMTGPLTVRLTAVFRTWGLATFYFSPPIITHPVEQRHYSPQEHLNMYPGNHSSRDLCWWHVMQI